MKISAAERLRRFYEVFPGDSQVLVVINADPDAMASALAVKRLLWRRVAGVTLCHINVMQRPDNLAMVRLLGIQMTHVDQVNPEQFNRFVIVDSQPGHHETFSRFTFHVVIDHHPNTGYPAAFSDIRPEFGATASTMTEYLRAARIKPSARLATGLTFAIKTDTSNFEHKTLIEDLRAFQFLFNHANAPMLRRMEQSEITMDFLKYFRIALESLQQRKGKIFVHLGPVSNPDVCVIIADFFMRMSSIRWSIVAGSCNNKLIVIFRNDGIRKNAGRVAKAAFEPPGFAGGHKNMARAEIPLADIQKQVEITQPKKVLNWVIRQIEKNTGTK